VNAGRSDIYAGLAAAAGKACGLSDSKEIAESADARAARDCLWLELDGRLADEKTYMLKDVREWLASKGVDVSMASVHRARERMREKRRVLELASARTAEVLKGLAGLDGDQLLDGATKRAGQVLMDLFLDCRPESFADLTAAQWLHAFEVAGGLARSRADVRFMDAKVKTLREKFEAAVKTRQSGRSDGRLSPEEIEEIGRDVFGDAAQKSA